MKLFSNIISFVFHPLLMVTYGIVLALMFTALALFPLPIKLLMAGGVPLHGTPSRAVHLFVGEERGGRGY